MLRLASLLEIRRRRLSLSGSSTSNPIKPLHLTLAKAEKGVDSSSPPKQILSSATLPFDQDQTLFVGQEDVPLDGVIQFEKPENSSRFKKWGDWYKTVVWLYLLVGIFWLCLCSLQLEDLVMDFWFLMLKPFEQLADPFIAGMLLFASLFNITSFASLFSITSFDVVVNIF